MTLVNIYISCIIINRGKNTFELVGTVLKYPKTLNLANPRQLVFSPRVSQLRGLRYFIRFRVFGVLGSSFSRHQGKSPASPSIR